MENFLEDVTTHDLIDVLSITDELKLCVKSEKSGGLTPVGQLSISKSGTPDEFKVNLLSEAKIQALSSTSEITAVVGKNFKVLSQEYTESMEQVQAEFVTRHTKFVHEDDCLVVVQGKNKVNLDVTEEFHGKKVLGELGSMVFESLLARVGFHQEVKLDWLDRSNVSCLATVTYRPLPDKTVTALDGSSTMGYGVEKVIQRGTENSSKIVWHSYYLPDGKLLERTQQTSEVSKNNGLKTHDSSENVETNEPALPFYAVVETIPESSGTSSFEKNSGNKGLNGDVNKMIDISEDVQMQSEFSKLKKAHLADHRTWLREHPLAMNILSDLTQHLLVSKPEDPIKEMKVYFDV